MTGMVAAHAYVQPAVPSVAALAHNNGGSVNVGDLTRCVACGFGPGAPHHQAVIGQAFNQAATALIPAVNALLAAIDNLSGALGGLTGDLGTAVNRAAEDVRGALPA